MIFMVSYITNKLSKTTKHSNGHNSSNPPMWNGNKDEIEID